MKPKYLLIPVATLALTATTTYAFYQPNTEALSDAGFSDAQITTLETIREMRLAGDVSRETVHELLDKAGITQENMQKVREIRQNARTEHRTAVREAIENEDYEAYTNAVKDTPHANVIDSQESFEKLVTAHTLRQNGDHEEARAIMEELGLKKQNGAGFGHGNKNHGVNKNGSGQMRYTK